RPHTTVRTRANYVTSPIARSPMRSARTPPANRRRPPDQLVHAMRPRMPVPGAVLRAADRRLRFALSGYRAAMSSLSEFLAEPRNVIVAGIRRDGRPHLSPNFFFWDGERFFISTTRDRVKYKIFSRDPRVELIIDDATGHRYARVSGTVEILEDV